jgi:nucleoside-diphosphate-sugar epimerase
MIETNLIYAAFRNGVKRLLFLNSGCIYPKHTEQLVCEDALLTGALEPTSEPHAIAKIAGITFVNVGTGEDVTIRDLAELITSVVGYEGKLEFDDTKPDGTPRKLLDVSRINNLGWPAKIPLKQGLGDVYSWSSSRAGLRL